MNISTDFEHLSPDATLHPEGYEWWYFDGLSTDGEYGFVIIFYRDNPFSTHKIVDLNKKRGPHSCGEYPAVSISIYKNHETLYYSFLEFGENEFKWDDEEKKLQIGSDEVRFMTKNKSIEFEIKLDQQLASGHSISGLITGSASRPSVDLIQASDQQAKHSWNLLLPSADINTELEVEGRDGREEVVFNGTGYHDHNSGNEPMKDSFRDWYWGRYHFGKYNLIYYLMNKKQGQQFEAWLTDEENQELLEHFEQAELDYYTRSWFGLNSARKIDLNSRQASVNIQCSHKIDDGPFYQRFWVIQF